MSVDAHSSVSCVATAVFFFFFSSRRRHTRSLCDWSSDVCSSDLVQGVNGKKQPGCARSCRAQKVRLPAGAGFCQQSLVARREGLGWIVLCLFTVSPGTEIGLLALNFFWGTAIGKFSEESVGKQIAEPEQDVW